MLSFFCWPRKERNSSNIKPPAQLEIDRGTSIYSMEISNG